MLSTYRALRDWLHSGKPKIATQKEDTDDQSRAQALAIFNSDL